jgi:hypothetical protein
LCARFVNTTQVRLRLNLLLVTIQHGCSFVNNRLGICQRHSDTVHQDNQSTYESIYEEIDDSRETVYRESDTYESAYEQPTDTAQQSDYSQIIDNEDTSERESAHVNEYAAHVNVILSENGRNVTSSTRLT